MAAFLLGKDPDETDITEQPTEPIPVQAPTLAELILRQDLKKTDIDDFDACVLCMRSYESQFGRPVDGEDYDSKYLGICLHHLWLWRKAHDDEQELMRAQYDESYARYRSP